MSATVTEPELPLALAACPNVEKFAAVDGAAMVFASDDGTTDVRGNLDGAFSDTDMEFFDAVLPFEVDSEIPVDCDVVFIYE